MKLKPMLLILALSLCAAAQTIGGFPEYGILLTGDLTTPTLENHSTQTILLIRTLQVHENGRKEDATKFMLPSLSPRRETGLKPGETTKLMDHHGDSIPGITDSPVVSTELKTIVFSDGEVVGPPDLKREASLEIEFQSIINVGRLAQAGNWSEVHRLYELQMTDAAGTPGAYGRNKAANLVFLHENRSAADAQKFAAELVQLPANFWRKQQ